MDMLEHKWTEAEATAAYATYIGRSGCKPIAGVEVNESLGKRVTLTPLGVDNCQIDIPAEHLGKVIAMLKKMDKKIKAAKAKTA